MHAQVLQGWGRPEDLTATEFVDVIMHLYVENSMHEFAEERDKARALVMRRISGASSTDYDSYEHHGSSNDALDPMRRNEAPMPFIPATEQTEDGFAGLLPPLGQ